MNSKLFSLLSNNFTTFADRFIKEHIFMSDRTNLSSFKIQDLPVNILKIIVLAAIAVSLIMLFFPRSLWFDEAALADNIIVRDLRNLIDSPLDNGQAAPALYLVAVKLLCLVFGYSEAALRLFSFLSYLWLLLMTFVLLRDTFRADRFFLWTGVALAATFSLFLRYSTELKQYMTETAAVLTVVYAFWLYWNKKLNISVLSLLYVLLIFLSNNAIFFIASAFIVNIIFELRKRNIRGVLQVAAHGAVVATVFGIYWLLWLSIVANSDFMHNFWEYWAFRFTPLSWDRYYWNALMLNHLLKSLSPSYIVRSLFVTLTIAGFVVSIRRKSLISALIGLAFMFYFIASHFYMAPIAFRLCLFFFIFAIIYIVIFLNFFASQTVLTKRFTWIKYACLAVAAVVFHNNIKFIDNINYAYPDDNTKPVLDYVREHIREDETLYSYLCCNYVVRYETRYTNHIGASRQEIIYGQTVYDWFGGKYNRKEAAKYAINPWEMVWDYGYDWDYPNEIDRVIAAGKAYIIFTHLLTEDADVSIGYGLNRLEEVGTVVKIMEQNRTLLYYFSAD